MNYKEKLAQELVLLAQRYGAQHIGNQYAHPNEPQNSSVIFNNLSYNFQPDSWKAIFSNTSYFNRTKKVHSKAQTKVPPVFEMQSSNSSDALAMNIFCHPDIDKWKGLKILLDVKTLSSEDIEFGFLAKVLKDNEGKKVEDSTEVDILLNNEIICECKLTEEGFTEKEKKSVENYIAFKDVFHIDKLMQNDKSYHNYQLIRNILAAKKQHNGRFILICDMRRPDLAKSFYQTIRCIKDDHLKLRTECEIIYWQDIAQVVGKELKDFLREKYGII